MLTIEAAKNHPLWDRQVGLETEMRSLGVEKFREATRKAVENGQETRVAPVRRLMTDAHAKMVTALEGFYAEVEAKKAGRKHCAYGYLKPMDTDIVAHLTCRVVLDMSAQKKTLTHMAVILAEALEDEVNYRVFKEQHRAGFLKSASRAKNKGNAGYKRRTVLETARKLEVELVEWPKRDMILLGSKLVELFVEATNLAGLVKTQNKLTVETNPEARSWIEKEALTCELMAPTYLPTLIPPKPWTTPFDGGYWTGRARRLTLVKGTSRAYLEELSAQEMPEVYTAVNALQNTAWAINERVYDVMQSLYETNSELDVIPHAETIPLPPKPLWLVEGLKKEDMTTEQQELFVKWKGECAAIYDENAEMEGRRRAFVNMLWVARRFKGEEAFHYPYALDWRGRAYPVGLYLQPQGNDAQRGLLEFSDVAPIHDQESADWLAIHGAGLWGVDKCSFEERVAWIEVQAETETLDANIFDSSDVSGVLFR